MPVAGMAGKILDEVPLGRQPDLARPPPPAKYPWAGPATSVLIPFVRGEQSSPRIGEAVQFGPGQPQ